MSRTQNALTNLTWAVLFQAAGILAAFLARKVFVTVLSQTYLGLDGTFANLLTMLSLAELGVGSAITYSLYKPLAQGDEGQILALMGLYQTAYRRIGLTVFGLGALLTPWLPVLIPHLPPIPHISLIYLLFVGNAALSYGFVYKQSLILADQKQYIVTAFRYSMKLLMLLLQGVGLLLTRNYLVYLIIQLAMTLCSNLLLARKADRLYPLLRRRGERPALEERYRREIGRNIKALFLHKVGAVAVLGTDNLLISYFVGVVEVGIYSNYLLITKGLHVVYGALFSSITAGVGNLGATAEGRQGERVFGRVHFAARWLYGWSAVSLLVLLNPFLTLWLGAEYCFPQEVVGLIALQFYLTGMRTPVSVFREAYGLYWYDRYKPLAEAAVNLAASIGLAIPFGVAGILMGTVLSTLTTCFWIEPLVLYRHGLHAPVGHYVGMYAAGVLDAAAAGVLTWALCALVPGAGWAALVGKGLLCVCVPNGLFLWRHRKGEEWAYYEKLAAEWMKKRGR